MTFASKAYLRKQLRAARRSHVEAQPDTIRALLFNTPPRPLQAALNAPLVIGLYHSTAYEAPTQAYARFFHEAGFTIALPRFADETAAMEFAQHTDPFAQSDLENGSFQIKQPPAHAPSVIPDIVFVPLVGFTASGSRLGQGGGHYDRWLAEHRPAKTIGLAWDVQLVDDDKLPVEPHDQPLDAVVTPTRIYGAV